MLKEEINKDIFSRLENEKIIDARIREIVPKILKGPAFTYKKITDTPTDDLQVVNRKFVTNNGSSFPTNPVTGQSFFSSVLSMPTWYNGTNWVDSTASVIG